MTAHLGKPKEVLSDGGGAALDLHQRDLIFSCHQDVVFVVEYCRQIYTPEEISVRHTQQFERNICQISTLKIVFDPSRKGLLRQQQNPKMLCFS